LTKKEGKALKRGKGEGGRQLRVPGTIRGARTAVLRKNKGRYDKYGEREGAQKGKEGSNHLGLNFGRERTESALSEELLLKDQSSGIGEKSKNITCGVAFLNGTGGRCIEKPEAHRSCTKRRASEKRRKGGGGGCTKGGCEKRGVYHVIKLFAALTAKRVVD